VTAHNAKMGHGIFSMPASPIVLDSVMACWKAEVSKRPLAVLGIATVLSAMAFFLWVITDYRQVWVHPEYFYQIDRHAIPNKHLGFGDVLGFFNCDAIGEHCTRARFVTYLVTGPVVKIRLLLWQVLPPHPSFSPIWLLSIASLFLLFRAVVLLIKRSDVAYAIVGLYIVSVGFMSHFAQLLHAAKPLVCFFMIGSIYCAARLIDLGPREPITRRLLWWGALGSSLVGAFLSDEIGWFMWPAIPLIAPSLFVRDGRLLWRPVLGYVAVPLGTIIFLTFIAPIGSWFLFKQQFNFWGWAFHWGWRLPGLENVPEELSLLERFTMSAILNGGRNMAYNIVVVPQLGLWATTVGWSLTVTALAVMFAFAPNKWLVIRLSVVLCGYIAFQGLITLRGVNVVGNTTYHTYYYGSSFPIFALLVLAPLLAGGVGRGLALIIVPYLFVAQIGNFMLLNDDARVSLERQSYGPSVTDKYAGIGYNTPLTFARTLEVWRAARRGEQVASYANQLSVSDLWLLREMQRLHSR
jgi:hypothetical protein